MNDLLDRIDRKVKQYNALQKDGGGTQKEEEKLLYFFEYMRTFLIASDKIEFIFDEENDDTAMQLVAKIHQMQRDGVGDVKDVLVLSAAKFLCIASKMVDDKHKNTFIDAASQLMNKLI